MHALLPFPNLVGAQDFTRIKANLGALTYAIEMEVIDFLFFLFWNKSGVKSMNQRGGGLSFILCSRKGKRRRE